MQTIQSGSVLETKVGPGRTAITPVAGPRTIIIPLERGIGRKDLPDPSRPVSTYTAKEVGAEGEEMATAYLEDVGFEIVARNWRCRLGEVDVIARGDNRSEVILVEVKTRVVMGHEAETIPELSVGRRKQTRYKNLALLYLSVHPDLTSVRFDVIAVNLTGHFTGKLRHLVGAYAWDEN